MMPSRPNGRPETSDHGRANRSGGRNSVRETNVSRNQRVREALAVKCAEVIAVIIRIAGALADVPTVIVKIGRSLGGGRSWCAHARGERTATRAA
jgi:hypothetical protein